MMRRLLLIPLLGLVLLAQATAQTRAERLGYYRRDSDEASRQRMSQQFRADAERLSRRNEDLRSSTRGSEGGGAAGSTASSEARRRGGAGAAQPSGGGVEGGPQSIESTRTEVVHIRETEVETAQRLLREAAQGQPESMWNAGRLLFTGGFGGVARNEAQALDWFRKAATAGHALAATALGEACLFGRGMPPDAAQAVRWLRAGAEAGVPRAQLQYGTALYLGDGGLAQDRNAAAAWLMRASDGGEPHAQWLVGSELRRGGLWPQDSSRARRLLQQAAEQEQPLAMAELAEMWSTGEGGPADVAQARRWWLRAAEQGDTLSMQNAALLLFRGQGGAADPVRAEALLRAAAGRGQDTEAQYALGARLYEGTGLKQDLAEAARWLELAVARDHADAQGLLGFMIANQAGVAPDPARALDLMRRGARAGSVLAADYLGEVLFLGTGGIARDMTEAGRWNRVAAEGGRWFAQLRWGYQLKHGLGTPAQGREGYRWLKQALDNGLGQAREHLDPAFVAANR